MAEGVSRITVQISKLEAAEDRTHDTINRISSLLHDILEPQSQNVNGKQQVSSKQGSRKNQEVSDKRIELTASIKVLNNIREQSRYGYRLLYTRWGNWEIVQGQDENKEIAEQVKKLNQRHERNRQGIVALWREVRGLHRKEEKLVGEKGAVGCKAGKVGTGGMAWGHVLRLFSGMELNL